MLIVQLNGESRICWQSVWVLYRFSYDLLVHALGGDLCRCERLIIKNQPATKEQKHGPDLDVGNGS